MNATGIRRCAARSISDITVYVRNLLFVIIVWELTAQFRLVPEQALPHTYTVALALVDMTRSGVIITAATTTISRAVIALALAVLLGVTLGLAMGRIGAVAWFFDPIISIGFPIPKITLVPIYMVWFGFGTLPTILLATTTAVFPVTITTYHGAKGVDRELLWSARSMDVSRVESIWMVMLPACLPEILNGVQISLYLSIVIVIIAEMVSASGGLGEILVRSIRFFDTEITILAVFVAAILGFTANQLFQRARARIGNYTV